MQVRVFRTINADESGDISMLWCGVLDVMGVFLFFGVGVFVCTGRGDGMICVIWGWIGMDFGERLFGHDHYVAPRPRLNILISSPKHVNADISSPA